MPNYYHSTNTHAHNDDDNRSNSHTHSQNSHTCACKNTETLILAPQEPTATNTHTHAAAQAHIRTHTHTHMSHSYTHSNKTTTQKRAHKHMPARRHARADGLALPCERACAFHRRQTPLMYAALKGHAAVAVALLAHGADANAKESMNGCGGRSLFWATVGVRRTAVAG